MRTKYILLSSLLSLLSHVMTGTIGAQESGHRVTGIVQRTDGSAIGDAIVSLLPGMYADTTDTSGQFAFQSVMPGNYTLVASAPMLGLEDERMAFNVPLNGTRRLTVTLLEKTYHVDEVIVMSKRKSHVESSDSSPSFVTVVERADFENEAVTVADVIKATPGASITVMGGLGDYTEVSLRGSYSNQVQVFIDGMLLNEAVGGAVNLGTIPLANVERVEVWRSGAPARFGGNAAGGVVNIITRDIHSDKKSVSLGYGSFGTVTAGTVVSIPRGLSRFLATVDYSASKNNFEYLSDNGTMYNTDDDYWADRSNDEYRSVNMLGKYSRVLGSGMLLEMSEHFLSSAKNLPGKDNMRYSHASLETMKNLLQARVTVQPLFSETVDIQPVIHHIHTRERYRDEDGSVGWGVQDNIYTTDAISFMSPLSARLGKYGSLSFIPVAKHESYRPDHKQQSTVPLSCDRRQFAVAFDGQVYTPGRRITVTANFRRDRYFSSFDGQPSPQNRITPDPKYNHLNSSHAGMKIQFLDNALIKTNYGDVGRVPGFYELFGDRGSTLSNPNLKPERTFQRDIGMRTWFGGMNSPLNGTLECVLFNNTFRNLIQWYTNDAGFVAAENVGGSYVKGVEVIWSTNILESFTCTGNWTFQKSKVTAEKRSYYREKQLPNRPKNYGTIKIELRAGRFVPFWSLDRKSSYYLDRANQEHKQYDGRSLHDVGLIVSFSGGKSTCTLLARNITNVHTFDTIGLPKPGRSIMVTLNHSL
ncbi:TonB-dependent receptor [Candidatus Latescibacterota bacterium]